MILHFTDKNFEIYLQNHLYFQQFIDELKAIEIIKCKNYPDYDVNFIGMKERIIRLSIIILHEKKVKEALKTIEEW